MSSGTPSVVFIIGWLSTACAGLAIEDVISAKIVYDESLKENAATPQLLSFLPGYNKL